MRRREFISLIGGSALMAPRASFAQATDRVRRIGMLMSFAADKPEGRARETAFVQGLQKLGWTPGGNVQIDTAGPRTMPILSAVSRRNWSRWRRTSFLPPSAGV